MFCEYKCCQLLEKIALQKQNITLRSSGGLSVVLLQLKDPLEPFVKRMEVLPGSGFLFRRDMTKAVESDIKPHSFLFSSGRTV